MLNRSLERQKQKNELIKRISEQRSSHLMLAVVELLECLIEEDRDELENLRGEELARVQGSIHRNRQLIGLITRELVTESKFKGLGLS